MMRASDAPVRLVGNGTIHPSLKLADFHSDGNGGMRLTVQTSEGRVEVKPISLAYAARLQKRLAEFIADNLKDMEA